MGKVNQHYQTSWVCESAELDHRARPMNRGPYRGPYCSYYTSPPTRPSLPGLILWVFPMHRSLAYARRGFILV